MQIIDLIGDRLRPVILAARQIEDNRNSLAAFLPNTPVQSVSYRMGRRRRLDQTVPIRAIDAPATPIRRPGMLDVQGDLPALSPIENLTEQDLTNEMIIAQQLAGLQVDWVPSIQSAAGVVAATIDNTLELMRASVLSTGALTLTATDGSTFAVDFEVPSDQKPVAAASWTGAGDAFVDLIAAHDAYIDAAGGPAGVMLAGKRVRRHLSAALQTTFPQQVIGQVALDAYMNDKGLPPLRAYDRVMEGPTGAKTRIFPDDVVTFLPGDSSVGRTELGITQESVQQVQSNLLRATEAPGITIVTLGQDNPVQRAVKGAALGMPVLRDTDAIVILSGVFG